MTTTPLAPGYTRTRPATGARKGTSTYSALLAQVKENGLLRRRTGFYWALFSALVGSLALTWVAFAFLGDSWFQLIVAGALGVLFTQFA
ncbi:acyl-CoA desaturase, partial [Curtobacterium flaccumfaciens pv. poinsettiae]|nr:acyl-CoA desaturase [Curtobacterium flaccumfaciens pv. poinsettiae]